jgi:hypothetical protein
MISIDQQQPETLTTTSCVKKSLEPKSERSVRFSPAVIVRETFHLDDYSDDEFFACWFTAEDYKTMKKVIKCTVNMIEQKVLLDEVNFTERGLEGKIKEATVLRRESRLAAIDSVLDEQKMQLEEGSADHELLAIVYSECIYRSKVAAYLSTQKNTHCPQKRTSVSKASTERLSITRRE